MTTTSDIGGTITIYTGAPATFDEAGYQALTGGAEIGGAIEIGGGGTTHADITIPDLKTGFDRVVKGAETGAERTISWRYIDGDAGQAAAIAASAARHGEYTIAVTSGDGSRTEWATGIVKNYQANGKSTSSFEGGQVVFRQNYNSVNAATV